LQGPDKGFDTELELEQSDNDNAEDSDDADDFCGDENGLSGDEDDDELSDDERHDQGNNGKGNLAARTKEKTMVHFIVVGYDLTDTDFTEIE
jgi:hypothetical protein